MHFHAVGYESILPPPGRLVTVMVDWGGGDSCTEVVIANVDGEFYAIGGICEHAGGALGTGYLVGCQLTCPLHGWTYDVTDGWLITPPLGRRIESYVVRVRDGQVEVAAREES